MPSIVTRAASILELQWFVVVVCLWTLSFPTPNRADAQLEAATLVVRGGKIVTVDPEHPEVEAIAIRGNRILAVGTNATISEMIGESTQIIELEGRLAIPGFIEGHGHFLGLGQSRMMLDLTQAQTWADVVEQVETAAKLSPPGAWIVGRGWHQEKWSSAPEPNVDGYPTHNSLSTVSPQNPVLLTHASGHMCFANDYAMRLAGIDRSSPDPDGGEIVRDETGQPIGVFRETAAGLIERAHARDEASSGPGGNGQRERNNLLRAIELATRECLSRGITSFQDAGTSFENLTTFQQLAQQDKLGIRLWFMVRDTPERLKANLQRFKTAADETNRYRFAINGIKLSIDGALGAHGAWLLEPYEDMPSSRGLNTDSLENAENAANLAVQHGYQLCIHAIGDRANREILDMYQRTFDANPSLVSRRWRIEHAQHLHPDDIPRFAQLEVIASMQGIHCTSDAVFVLQRLGARRAEQGAYMWQSLLQSGATVTNGTDAPVEDVDPIASFFASVTRQLDNGARFFPEQCMTREQALYSYTMAPAFAAWEENIKGSLTPGKLADMVILDTDIMTCDESEIPDAQVAMTILGGEVVYDASQVDDESDGE